MNVEIKKNRCMDCAFFSAEYIGSHGAVYGCCPLLMHFDDVAGRRRGSQYACRNFQRKEKIKIICDRIDKKRLIEQLSREIQSDCALTYYSVKCIHDCHKCLEKNIDWKVRNT